MCTAEGPIDNRSTLSQAMVWRHQAKRHKLNQCWQGTMAQCVASRPKCVKIKPINNHFWRRASLCFCMFLKYYFQQSIQCVGIDMKLQYIFTFRQTIECNKYSNNSVINMTYCHQIPKLKWFPCRFAVAFVQSIEAMCQVENEDVVGAVPTGDAATTSKWSTIAILPTKVWLILEVWW